MKKTNLFLLTFLCLSLFSNAQITFENFYGVDVDHHDSRGLSVQQTTDNGYIIAGCDSIDDIGETSRTVVIKTDFKGDTLWTKHYYPGVEANVAYIRQTTDNGYVFTDAHYITKIDSIGNVLWVIPYSVNSVQQTNDGGYIGIGYNNNLIKADANGDTLWTKPYNGFFVQQTTDNGYIIFDRSPDSLFFFKTDINGNSLWTKSYYIENWEPISGQQTIDGGYIVLYMKHFPNGHSFLFKTDTNGDSLWTKSYPENYTFLSFQQTFDEGYIIAGSSTFSFRTLLFKVDANGDSLWSHNYYQGFGASKFFSVQQTNDSGYVAVGYCHSPYQQPPYVETYIVKTDKNGNGCFFTNTYQDQEICIVTVDTTSGKNMIIWEKNDSVGIESFNIYKQGSTAGVYDSIANIPFDSLSVFTDNTSNPAQHADLYKISVIDTCGFESELSPAHKTIHLSVSGSMAQGFELIWDEYIGFNFGTYYIYRGINNNLVLIDSVASNLYSWTDVNPPCNNVYYQVAVFSPNPCNPTGGSKIVYNKSVSNIADSETGINEITDNGKFDIYPNPAKNYTRIDYQLPTGINRGEIVFYDAKGNEIKRFVVDKTFNHLRISTSELSSGTYFYNLQTSKGIVGAKKMVVIK